MSIEEMKELIGNKIKQIFVNETKLVFITEEDKQLVYWVDADCCSHSYFSEIMHPDSILRHTIIEVEELATMSGEATTQEEDSIYGYKITFDKLEGLSNCIVNFRNSSNGYYGGWCNFQESNTSLENLTEVKENYIADWRAF